MDKNSFPQIVRIVELCRSLMTWDWHHFIFPNKDILKAHHLLSPTFCKTNDRFNVGKNVK